MDAVERLLEHQAICELKARYCRLMDEKRWEEWGLLFTDDAELVTAGSTTNGRDPIRDMVHGAMEGIPSSHQAFLPEISFKSATSANGVWAAMFIQSQGRTTGVGHYHEEYRKVDGTWQIARSELVTAFVEGSAVPDQLLD
ncbi:MAG: nuclear transport factor 2 family protein [Ilumatobacteraceae bacterium]